MREGYSFTKGLAKGALQLLTVTGALVAFAGLSDITIWELAEQYIKPVLGSLTVGGVIAFALNYLRYNYR